MACDPFREALSARLDGESPGLPEAEVDAHVAGCPVCRDWLEAAAEVTRRARLVPATPLPDVTAAVLDRLPARPAVRRRLRWADPVLRAALLVVGVGQLVVALPALVGDHAPMTDPMSAPVHLAHETGAWNVGLAACFLVVAALPRLAAGALPFLLSFTAVLSWVTVGDLGAGHVHADRAVAHGFLLLGALLVTALALRSRTPRGGPVLARTPGSGAWVREVGVRLRGAHRQAPGRPALRAAGPPAVARASTPCAASAERSAA
ncbi:MAG TPA: zf-HC2 domain-containing protein [Modestobacter sp.]|nr:zf-HC2 domain-containing protein [Modestobacter sp.]